MATLFRNCYQYYDTKDGEDCPKKIWYVTKGALLLSAWVGPCYCAMVTQPVGVWQTMHGLGTIAVPLVAAAATFAATTCALTNARGTDDALNPILGGFASGAIFGTANKSFGTGARWGGIFAVAAYTFKAAEQYDWKWWEQPNYPQRGSVGLWKHDWTLLKDPSKTNQ